MNQYSNSSNQNYVNMYKANYNPNSNNTPKLLSNNPNKSDYMNNEFIQDIQQGSKSNNKIVLTVTSKSKNNNQNNKTYNTNNITNNNQQDNNLDNLNNDPNNVFNENNKYSDHEINNTNKKFNPNNTKILHSNSMSSQNKNLPNENKENKEKNNNDNNLNNRSYSSNDNSNINKNEMSQEEVLKTLKSLFELYCQFGDRLNTSKMSITKFRKLIKESEIEQHLPIKDFDLIFTKLVTSKQYKNFYLKNLKQSNFNNSNNGRMQISFNNPSNSALYIKSSNNANNLTIKVIDFEGFLQTLVLISEQIVNMHLKTNKNNNVQFSSEEDKYQHKKETAKETLSFLIHQHLLPCYRNTVTKLNSMSSEIKSNLVITNLHEQDLVPKINIKMKELIENIAPLLYNLYKHYYNYEFTAEEFDPQNEKTKNSTINFLKDFDLYPSLVSKYTILKLVSYHLETEFEVNKLYLSLIKKIELPLINDNSHSNENNNKEFSRSSSPNHTNSIINSSTNIKNQINTNNTQIFGRTMTFFRFLRFLLSISDSGFDINLEFLDNYEKLCLLFERMENSDGFVKIQKKIFLSSKKLRSFQLPEEVVFSLQKKVKDNFSYNNQINNMGTTTTEINRVRYDSKAVKSNMIDNYEISFFEIINSKYYDILSEVFSYYCCFLGNSAVLNSNKMKFQLFKKMTKEAGLLAEGNNRNTSHGKLYNTNKSKYSNSVDLNTKTNEDQNKKSNLLSDYDIEKVYIKVVNMASEYSNINNVNNNITNTNMSNTKILSKSFIGGKTKTKFNNYAGKGNLNNSIITNTWNFIDNNENTKNFHKNILSSMIDYQQFIYALELFSIVLYGELDPMSSVDFLIENHIINLLNKISKSHKKDFEMFEYYINLRNNDELFVSDN